METVLSDLVEKAQIEKRVEAHFAKRGWSVRRVLRGRDQSEIHVQKGLLKLFLICVDGGPRRYLSQGDILVRLASESRIFRQSYDQGLIFILSTKYTDIACDEAANQGALIFGLTELDILTDLESFEIGPPQEVGDLDTRKRILVSEKVRLCHNMALRFIKEKKDFDSAIAWYRLAVDASNRVSPVSKPLFDLYMRAGYVDRAYEFAEKVVRLDQKNVVFLRFLVQISKQRGDDLSIEHWTTQLVYAEQELARNPKDLTTIVESQQSERQREHMRAPVLLLQPKTASTSPIDEVLDANIVLAGTVLPNTSQPGTPHSAQTSAKSLTEDVSVSSGSSTLIGRLFSRRKHSL